MAEIVINGKTHPLTGNPTHGMVRAVKNSQRQLMSDLIKKYKDTIQLDGSTPIQTAIGRILAEHPDVVTDFENRQAEENLIATLSLATGQLFAFEELETTDEKELQTAFTKCKKALGSDASSFFSFYEGNSSSKTNVR